jgi:hypothetical protein
LKCHKCFFRLILFIETEQKFHNFFDFNTSQLHFFIRHGHNKSDFIRWPFMPRVETFFSFSLLLMSVKRKKNQTKGFFRKDFFYWKFQAVLGEKK